MGGLESNMCCRFEYRPAPEHAEVWKGDGISYCSLGSAWKKLEMEQATTPFSHLGDMTVL